MNELNPYSVFNQILPPFLYLFYSVTTNGQEEKGKSAS